MERGEKEFAVRALKYGYGEWLVVVGCLVGAFLLL